LAGQTKNISDSELLQILRAKKYTTLNNPNNPTRPKFSKKPRGVRVTYTKFVCYQCELVWNHGWLYKTANLGDIHLCGVCKPKVVPHRSTDIMAVAIQGGGADGGK
jgi:hypothetical protein